MMKCFLYGIVVFLGFNITAFGGSMNKNYESYLELRRNQCEKKFGISKVKIADDNQGVVADWSRPDEWEIFKKETGWQSARNPNVSSRNLEVFSDIYFKKGEEKIFIDLYVSSIGNKAALDWLVEKASTTTMPEIPYKKAEGLGDLYVNSLHQNSRTLIWMYRNICFLMRHNFEEAQKPSLDTFALAKWIQQYAEKHLVNNMQAYYPKISHVNISQPKIYVGDTFNITLAGDKQESNSYSMSWKIDKHSLDYTNEEGLSLYVKALKPGSTDVPFTLVDLNTLLSTRKTVTINVLEKKQ